MKLKTGPTILQIFLVLAFSSVIPLNSDLPLCPQGRKAHTLTKAWSRIPITVLDCTQVIQRNFFLSKGKKSRKEKQKPSTNFVQLKKPLLFGNYFYLFFFCKVDVIFIKQRHKPQWKNSVSYYWNLHLEAPTRSTWKNSLISLYTNQK